MEHETKQKIAKRNDSEGGVSSDEIRAFMCGLIKAFRRPDAFWNHHIEAFTGNKAPGHVESVS